jgi:hypothetical protein
MQSYVATIKILVVTPSVEDACDVIASALNDPINTTILDWSYLPAPTEEGFAYPELHADINPATYIEGSFILQP